MRLLSRLQRGITRTQHYLQETRLYQGTSRLVTHLKAPALRFVKSTPNLLFMSSLAAVGAYSQCKTSVLDIFSHFVSGQPLNLMVIVVGTTAAVTTFISASFIIYKNITVLSNFAEKSLAQDKKIDELEKGANQQAKREELLLKHFHKIQGWVKDLSKSLKNSDDIEIKATAIAIEFNVDNTLFELALSKEDSVIQEEKWIDSTQHIHALFPPAEIELTTMKNDSKTHFASNSTSFHQHRFYMAEPSDIYAIEIKDPEIVSACPH